MPSALVRLGGASLASALLILGAAGCDRDTCPPPRCAGCGEAQEELPAGCPILACAPAFCADGGDPTDAGTTDAGATDAGTTDAGTTDAGSQDAGAIDSGLVDGGADGGVSDAGASDGLLIRYAYGNQITGSDLRIDGDGGVEHEERTCCPPVITPVPETALGAGALAELRAWISEASDAGVSVSTTGGAAGAKSGQLLAYTDDGREVVIRRYTLDQANLTHERNLAPDAGRIQSLVFGYTTEDMSP